MLIKNLEYLELTNSAKEVHGGEELVFAASTTNISGVYRGDGDLYGSVYGSARADLGGQYCYYGCSYDEPEAYAYTNGNIRVNN